MQRLQHNNAAARNHSKLQLGTQHNTDTDTIRRAQCKRMPATLLICNWSALHWQDVDNGCVRAAKVWVLPTHSAIFKP
jgi:hypothetical protein